MTSAELASFERDNVHRLVGKYGDYLSMNGIHNSKHGEFKCSKCCVPLADLGRVMRHIASAKHQNCISDDACQQGNQRQFATVKCGSAYGILCGKQWDEGHSGANNRRRRAAFPTRQACKPRIPAGQPAEKELPVQAGNMYRRRVQDVTPPTAPSLATNSSTSTSPASVDPPPTAALTIESPPVKTVATAGDIVHVAGLKQPLPLTHASPPLPQFVTSLQLSSCSSNHSIDIGSACSHDDWVDEGSTAASEDNCSSCGPPLAQEETAPDSGLPPFTSEAVVSYDGEEKSEDGIVEGGYLPVQLGDAVQLRSTYHLGHSGNRFKQYVYGNILGKMREGWLPVEIFRPEEVVGYSDAPTLADASFWD